MALFHSFLGLKNIQLYIYIYATSLKVSSEWKLLNEEFLECLLGALAFRLSLVFTNSADDYYILGRIMMISHFLIEHHRFPPPFL